MSFWYQKSTDFIVSLPIKQLGLISAWCSLWASRLICKLIRSKLKAVSCLLGTLELIVSRCWNFASLPHWAGCLTLLLSQNHFRRFVLSLFSDQDRATPWYPSFSHWVAAESSGCRYTVSSKLGHLLKDLAHSELPHANPFPLHCQMPHLVLLLHDLHSSMN